MVGKRWAHAGKETYSKHSVTAVSSVKSREIDKWSGCSIGADPTAGGGCVATIGGSKSASINIKCYGLIHHVIIRSDC
jgi:hypothetical protein